MIAVRLRDWLDDPLHQRVVVTHFRGLCRLREPEFFGRNRGYIMLLAVTARAG